MRLALLLLALLLLGGCQAVSGSPHLIELAEISPRRIAPGDRVELSGRGFPEGQKARLTFRGELSRAGQHPREVEISAVGESVSPRTLAFELDARLEQEFAGADVPVHTTFRGSLLAAFASRTAGSAPVTGELPEVVLDVVPQESLEQLEARAKEGARFAAFTGMLFVEGDRGLELAGVLPGSRAESAGLTAGDLLYELDGLRLFGLSDLLPRPSEAPSRVLVRRNGEKDPVPLLLDGRGFKPRAADELVPLAALAAVAAFLALLFLTPLGRAFTWFERRLLQSCREVSRDGTPVAAGLASRSALSLSRELPAGAAAYLGVVVAVAAFAALALDRTLVAAELDLPLLYLVATTALLAARALRAGLGLAQRVRTAACLAALQVPLLLSLLTPVLAAGSVRVSDLTAVQGALPFRYGAFHSPMAFVAALVAFASLLPRAERASEAGRAGGSGTLLRVTEALHLMVCCLLGAVLFFGGHRLPGVSLVGGSLWFGALGALALAAKGLLLFAFVHLLRSGLGRLDVVQAWPLVARFLLPASVLALLLTATWTRFAEQSPLAVAGTALGYACFATACVLLVLIVARVAAELRKATPEVSVSPWL